MRTTWPALRAQLLLSTLTLTFQQQFRRLGATEPALTDFPDPPALVDALHGETRSPEARNAVLTALVQQAQAGHQAAVTALLLALWPGLDAVHRRLARHFRGDPDTLAAEIVGRTVAGIHALDLARVTRVAATLIMNCERDILRELQRRWREKEPGSWWTSEAPSPSSRLGLPEGLDADAATIRLVRLIEPMVGDDASLVVAIAVLGEEQAVAAEALGLRPDAGRKRYQRALQRLRTLLAEKNVGDPCPEYVPATAFPHQVHLRTADPRTSP